MADLDRDQVQNQCMKFLDSLGKSGFIVMGWKKDDGTVEVVQSLKDMEPMAYLKSMTWAMNEVTSRI